MADDHQISDALSFVVNESVRLLNAKAAYIRLLEGGVLVPGAATESAVQYLEDIAGLSTAALLNAGKTAAGQLITTKTPIVLDDITAADLILPETRRVAEKHGFHGTVGAPMLLDGQPVGVFFVFASDVRVFTDAEVSILKSLADQAALALENKG